MSICLEFRNNSKTTRTVVSRNIVPIFKYSKETIPRGCGGSLLLQIFMKQLNQQSYGFKSGTLTAQEIVEIFFIIKYLAECLTVNNGTA